mmetsp:Transcript_18072/g.26506  ORF Transcript_18072/g.26506 Transcript_18072/m.26506 type:complete len:379 (-) Transcript_18072:23-1159(-)
MSHGGELLALVDTREVGVEDAAGAGLGHAEAGNDGVVGEAHLAEAGQKCLGRVNDSGFTARHDAVELAEVDTLEVLLRSGANSLVEHSQEGVGSESEGDLSVGGQAHEGQRHSHDLSVDVDLVEAAQKREDVVLDETGDVVKGHPAEGALLGVERESNALAADTSHDGGVRVHDRLGGAGAARSQGHEGQVSGLGGVELSGGLVVLQGGDGEDGLVALEDARHVSGEVGGGHDDGALEQFVGVQELGERSVALGVARWHGQDHGYGADEDAAPEGNHDLDLVLDLDHDDGSWLGASVLAKTLGQFGGAEVELRRRCGFLGFLGIDVGDRCLGSFGFGAELLEDRDEVGLGEDAAVDRGKSLCRHFGREVGGGKRDLEK